MKRKFPSKRFYRIFHRWLGAAAALFLVLVSVTGLILNHSTRLGLDQIQIKSPLILNRYGMASVDSIQSFKINDQNSLSYLDDFLFINEEQFATGSIPVGWLESSPLKVLGTRKEIFFLSPTNDLVEKLRAKQLPWKELIGLGLSNDQNPVFITNSGLYTIDKDWINIKPFSGQWSPHPLPLINLDAESKEVILKNFQGNRISLYRFILDLHAGRIFGWGGRTLVDLSALAVLFLIASGVIIWINKPKKN